MTLKTLREMRDAAPFKPFEIHLADGRTVTVATADHLFFIPNNPDFLVVLPHGGFRIVDPPQLVSVGRGAARTKGRELGFRLRRLGDLGLSSLPEGDLRIARQFTAGFRCPIPQVPKGRPNLTDLKRLLQFPILYQDSAVPSGREIFLPQPHA